MPVILTTAAEIEHWLDAPAAEALQLQRPLPDGCLMIVARGGEQDGRQGEGLSGQGPRRLIVPNLSATFRRGGEPS